jgi:predicted house-cleaning noncanonical NTP pyrophosphatase (MazG superfamily)
MPGATVPGDRNRPGFLAHATDVQPPVKVVNLMTYQPGHGVVEREDVAALRAKLLEEAHEVQAAPDGKLASELASELADVLEVLHALAAVHDMCWEEVVSEASRKRAERGGFDHRIFLEYVDQAR